jgi:hypothetical protein
MEWGALMDRFAWAASLVEITQEQVEIEQGPGFIYFEGRPETCASISNRWNEQRGGKLLASAALFQMFDGKHRFLLLQEGRDLLGLTKGVWGFPTKPLRIDEFPENAARAALDESIELAYNNNRPWECAEYRPQGTKFITMLSHSKILGFIGDFVQTQHSIIFYVPLEILCVNPYAFGFQDRLLPQNPVRILQPIEIDYFAKQGLLSKTTELIWQNYKESLFLTQGR